MREGNSEKERNCDRESVREKVREKKCDRESEREKV